MASSQVEIASSSPFDYILNKHNRCCSRHSNSFKKNFKNLVQSHLHSCISNQSHKKISFDSCENSQKNDDLLIRKNTECDEENNNNSPKKRSKASEKWDKARNMVLSMEKENQECLNLGGVSSLVRKWKDFETESKIQECDESCCSVIKNESFCDLESDKTDINKDSERLGVADIIKKLTFDNANVVVVNGGSLPRVRTSMDHSEQQRCNFSPVLSSPRFIRGRQAFSDLLLQMERERQRELEGLGERKVVSKFQQRGRIQAVLRVRLIRHGAEVRGGKSTDCSASESNKSTHSAIMHLREKFNTVGKERAESIHETGSLPSTPNRKQKENSYRDFKSLKSPERELTRSSSAKIGTGFSLYQQREEDPLKGLIKERTGLQPGAADSRSNSTTSGENARDSFISKEKNHPKEASEQVSPRNVAQVRNRFSSNQQTEVRDQHQELVKERAGMQPGGVTDSRNTPTASGENTRDPSTSKEENHHQPRNLHKENHYEELCKKLSSRKAQTSIKVTNLSEYQKDMASSAKISEHDMDLDHQEISTSLPSFTSQAHSLDDIPDKASWGKTSSEASHCNLFDFLESARPPKDYTNPQSDREEEVNNQCLVESDSGSVSDYSLTASGWDELQSNEDWISSISRPRKEWEGLRQERYQEMLDPFSENHDIQQLLHRKSVSMFLTSDLREKIDRIMASRTQQLPNTTSRRVEEEVQAQVAEDKEEEVEQNAREEEEEEWGYEDDSEDDNSSSRQQYNEPEVSMHQNTSAQTLQSWSTNQEQEVTDDSYHFPSPASLQSQSSNIYSQHIQPPRSSSVRHHSTEMELIYEMRGHMEKLHQEIFEIRRSMKTCINMQTKLQRSIKQDVAAAISQLGQKSKANSDNKASNIGNCCICSEEPIDSLLYRCGHMCTCFRCAHELISGTGKCPVCQAPIMDVVRAYTHS